jgi:hypothetical protein
MGIGTEDQIGILMKEYENLLVRDRQLTAFYHRFATIGATLIGMVFYYAIAHKQAVFHAIPFLISSLVLFLEFWRMDTVETNAYMRQICRMVNGLSDAPLLIARQIGVKKLLFVTHERSSSKLLNPMFILILLLFFIFCTVLAISYYKTYEFFQVNESWSGWFPLYVVVSGCPLVIAVFVLVMLEGRGKIFDFWGTVAECEFHSQEWAGK